MDLYQRLKEVAAYFAAAIWFSAVQARFQNRTGSVGIHCRSNSRVQDGTLL